MGSVTRYNTCSMASIATFNMCLDAANSDDDSSSKRDYQALQHVLAHANGLNDLEGEAINKANAKDWRERFFDNLPYRADDCMLINLPSKVDQ